MIDEAPRFYYSISYSKKHKKIKQKAGDNFLAFTKHVTVLLLGDNAATVYLLHHTCVRPDVADFNGLTPLIAASVSFSVLT